MGGEGRGRGGGGEGRGGGQQEKREGRGREGREVHRVRQSNVKRMDVERRGSSILHRIISL